MSMLNIILDQIEIPEGTAHTDIRKLIYMCYRYYKLLFIQSPTWISVMIQLANPRISFVVTRTLREQILETNRNIGQLGNEGIQREVNSDVFWAKLLSMTPNNAEAYNIDFIHELFSKIHQLTVLPLELKYYGEILGWFSNKLPRHTIYVRGNEMINIRMEPFQFKGILKYTDKFCEIFGYPSRGTYLKTFYQNIDPVIVLTWGIKDTGRDKALFRFINKYLRIEIDRPVKYIDPYYLDILHLLPEFYFHGISGYEEINPYGDELRNYFALPGMNRLFPGVNIKSTRIENTPGYPIVSVSDIKEINHYIDHNFISDMHRLPYKMVDLTKPFLIPNRRDIPVNVNFGQKLGHVFSEVFCYTFQLYQNIRYDQMVRPVSKTPLAGIIHFFDWIDLLIHGEADNNTIMRCRNMITTDHPIKLIWRERMGFEPTVKELVKRKTNLPAQMIALTLLMPKHNIYLVCCMLGLDTTNPYYSYIFGIKATQEQAIINLNLVKRIVHYTTTFPGILSYGKYASSVLFTLILMADPERMDQMIDTLRAPQYRDEYQFSDVDTSILDQIGHKMGIFLMRSDLGKGLTYKDFITSFQVYYPPKQPYMDLAYCIKDATNPTELELDYLFFHYPNREILQDYTGFNFQLANLGDVDIMNKMFMVSMMLDQTPKCFFVTRVALTKQKIQRPDPLHDNDYTDWSDLNDDQIIAVGKLAIFNYTVYSIPEIIELVKMKPGEIPELPFDPALSGTTQNQLVPFSLEKLEIIGKFINSISDGRDTQVVDFIREYKRTHTTDPVLLAINGLDGDLAIQVKKWFFDFLTKLLELAFLGLQRNITVDISNKLPKWEDVSKWLSGSEADSAKMANTCFSKQAEIARMFDHFLPIINTGRDPNPNELQDPDKTILSILLKMKNYGYFSGDNNPIAQKEAFWPTVIKLLTSDYCVQIAARYLLGTSMYYLNLIFKQPLFQ